MNRLLGGIALSLVVSTSSALCAGAPQGALNKTVSMSWNTSGMSTTQDGQSRSFNNLHTRTVYISSAGRTFLRKAIRGGKSGRSGDAGPGESSGGSVRLEGNRLVGTETFMSGARQYVATFDASFSSCSLVVIDAKSGGSNIQRKGPDGRMYSVSNVSTGSPSCSIQSGNAFGGE